MAKSKGKQTDAALAEQLVAGIGKRLATAGSLLIDGQTLTPAQVTAKLQSLATLRNDVDAAKAATKAKLAVEKAEAPSLREFMLTFVTFVKAAFANQPDALADFGIAPKKVKAPLTVEQKAAAAAKRKATRQARGTMGPKKKQSVKGNVTGVVVTPVIAPEPAIPVVTTAPSAPAPAGATTGSAKPQGA